MNCSPRSKASCSKQKCLYVLEVLKGYTQALVNYYDDTLLYAREFQEWCEGLMWLLQTEEYPYRRFYVKDFANMFAMSDAFEKACLRKNNICSTANIKYRIMPVLKRAVVDNKKDLEQTVFLLNGTYREMNDYLERLCAFVRPFLWNYCNEYAERHERASLTRNLGFGRAFQPEELLNDMGIRREDAGPNPPTGANAYIDGMNFQPPNPFGGGGGAFGGGFDGGPPPSGGGGDGAFGGSGSGPGGGRGGGVGGGGGGSGSLGFPSARTFSTRVDNVGGMIRSPNVRGNSGGRFGSTSPPLGGLFSPRVSRGGSRRPSRSTNRGYTNASRRSRGGAGATGSFAASSPPIAVAPTVNTFVQPAVNFQGSSVRDIDSTLQNMTPARAQAIVQQNNRLSYLLTTLGNYLGDYMRDNPGSHFNTSIMANNILQSQSPSLFGRLAIDNRTTAASSPSTSSGDSTAVIEMTEETIDDPDASFSNFVNEDDFVRRNNTTNILYSSPGSSVTTNPGSPVNASSTTTSPASSTTTSSGAASSVAATPSIFDAMNQDLGGTITSREDALDLSPETIMGTTSNIYQQQTTNFAEDENGTSSAEEDENTMATENVVDTGTSSAEENADTVVTERVVGTGTLADGRGGDDDTDDEEDKEAFVERTASPVAGPSTDFYTEVLSPDMSYPSTSTGAVSEKKKKKISDLKRQIARELFRRMSPPVLPPAKKGSPKTPIRRRRTKKSKRSEA